MVLQHHVFHVFITFNGERSTKSMMSEYLLDLELNSPSKKFSHSKFEENHMDISSKYELKK